MLDTAKKPDAKTGPMVGRGPLEGRTAIVTGSTSGIGLGIARALAVEGCRVALNGRRASDETERLRERSPPRPAPTSSSTVRT